MNEQIIYAGLVIVFGRKSCVAFIVHVDFKRVPARHKHPNSQVELAFEDKEGVLEVLLDDPRLGTHS